MDDTDLIDYVKRLGCSQDPQPADKIPKKTSVKTFLSSLRASTCNTTSTPKKSFHI